jgi:rod shape-determining protein MreD
LVGRGHESEILLVAGRQILILRAALLVALTAVLDAALTPLLTFGWVGPKFMVLGVVVAVAGLPELQALLLGFFGGVLADTLGGELFGVGALGGVFAATASVRIRSIHMKREAHLILAQALAVAAYDLLSLFAPILVGRSGPPITNYLVGGMIPDVLLNAFLAYLVGRWLIRLVTMKEER